MDSIKVVKTLVSLEDLQKNRHYEFAAKRSKVNFEVTVIKISEDKIVCSVLEDNSFHREVFSKKYLQKFNIYLVEERVIKEFTTCSCCGAEGQKLYWQGKELLCSECLGKRLIADALKNKVIYDNWATNF